MSLLIVFASFAVLLAVTLLLKKKLLYAAVASLATAIVLTLLIFGMSSTEAVFLSAQGLLISLEIILLVFGALLFYNYLIAIDFISNLKESLQLISSNKLIIALLLAVFFGSFIEGVSGFGTPAMIVAPLLFGLGFPAYLAASLPLLANTIPVMFGAVGTPIKIGLADLPVSDVPIVASSLLTIPILLLPLVFRSLIPPALRSGSEGEKFVVVSAGFCFAALFISLSLTGPEFPSLVAPLAAAFAWMTLLKIFKFSTINITTQSISGFVRTFMPYLFVSVLLLAGKFLLQGNSIQLHIQSLSLTRNISYFQPGIVFLFALLILSLVQKKSSMVSYRTVFSKTMQSIPTTFATIACLAILARVVTLHLDITEIFSTSSIPRSLYYLFALATGFLGSFMAGSGTVSNLMFGNEWYITGEQLNLDITLLLACQVAGSALGNGLSIQNIAMVQAVISARGLEKKIIATIAKPIALFMLCTAVVILIAALIIEAGSSK